MTAEAPRRKIDHAITILGATVLLLSLLAIYVDLERAYTEIIRVFFTTDPRTGLVIERGYWAFFRFEPPDGMARLGTYAALVGVVITAWGARRLGRRHGVRLGLVASPVLVVLALGLLAGLLVHYRFQGELSDLFRALGGKPEAPNSCVQWLTSCSRVQAIDRIWGIVIPLLCVVSASTFLLAARHAWRAGAVRGLVLPRGIAYACIVLCIVGATSLIATMPHTRDLQVVAGQCEQHPKWEQPNMTSLDLRGMVVDRCAVDHRDAHPMVERTVELVVADAKGRVSTLDDNTGREAESFAPHELARQLGESISYFESSMNLIGEDHPLARALALYVDERTSPAALLEHLRVAREAGITDLLLYGQAFVPGRLETLGEWTSRTLCPAGWVRFDDRAELTPTDFSTWAELQRVAIERGDEPLLLRLPINR